MYEASIKIVKSFYKAVEEFLRYSSLLQEDSDFGVLQGKTRNGQVFHMKTFLYGILLVLEQASSQKVVVDLYILREAKRLDTLILYHQNDFVAFQSHFIQLIA